MQLNKEVGLPKLGCRSPFIRERSQAVSSPEKQAEICIFYTHCQHPHMTGGRFCHFSGPDPEQALPCP